MEKKKQNIKTLDVKGKTYISMVDFMRLTRLARVTIKTYVKQGKVDGLNFGSKWWINKESFDIL